MRRDDLVGAIMRITGGRGIDPGMALTLTGDKANYQPRLRGLFKKGGTADMSDLAELLRIEQGYDVRDGTHLEELIREQAAGNPVYSMERYEREAAENEERKYRDEINKRAVELGLKQSRGKRTLEMVEAEIARVEQEQNDMEAQEERAAIQAESAASEAFVDEGAPMTEDDFRRYYEQAANIEYTQEDFDRAEEYRTNREDARAAEDAFDAAEREAQSRSGERNQDGQAEEGARGTAESAGQDFRLNTYTESELAAREAAEQARAEAEKAAADKAEKEKQDRQLAQEVKRRSEAAAETFELGQGAMENVSGQGGLRFSKTQADTETDRQFKETERAYGGREAYDRAKVNGKTKLNYRQWVQVRTPKFKEWFGDWEALRAQERLDSMAPIKVGVPDDWRGLDEKAMREKMVAALDDLIANKTSIIHPEIGEIRFGVRGKKKSASTSRDSAKMLVVADIESAISNAVYARSEPTDEQGAIGYSKLLVPVNIDGTELVAVLSVRHQKDGNWYYNAVALLDDNEKRPGSYESPGTLSRPLGKTPITGLDSFIRQPLHRVNPDSVSKVTDPETGEPLVVYHGTAADFSAFDDAKAGANDRGLWGRGHYLTSVVRGANSYAERQGDGAQVIPAFISLKTPLILTTGQDLITRLPDGTNYRDLVGMNLDGSKIKRIAQSGGHDGVVQIKPDGFIGDLVAYTPTKIKSATGNNGNFDGSSTDIRESRASSTRQTPAKPELPADTLARKTQRKLQDKLNRFTVIKEWLAENGVTLSEQPPGSE